MSEEEVISWWNDYGMWFIDFFKPSMEKVEWKNLPEKDRESIRELIIDMEIVMRR